MVNSLKLSSRSKFIILHTFTSTGVILFLLFFYYSFSSSLKQEKYLQAKHLTEAGIGVIQSFQEQVEQGELTLVQAHILAKAALKSAVYGKNGYFWISNTQGRLLMHPYHIQKVGDNMLNWTDINGKLFFRDLIGEAMAGGGWVSYYWPKPNTDAEYPKISYVEYFDAWDWVLGTGIYLDDMQEEIYWAMVKTSGIVIGSFLVFTIVIILIVNYFVRELEELAIKDGLTNLYTKRFLKEILPSIINKNQRDQECLMAAIFMDIDHFKKVNDNFGHSTGDKVLRKIAQVMESNSRSEDFCIRFGGEEFLIVGVFADAQTTIDIAERIRTDVSQLLFSAEKKTFQVTLSAGIALYDNKSETFDDTIKRADKKLYESKQAGRNRVSI
ncbi:diguanylate cyclase [Psychromonas ossibalaenae]|uniref:diguanylate cyclase n=1 Tax=Psychromonas ossibalaenae TaxID=444922 RepID=UPI000369CAE7|nr:diguanylate cyclase [Psychromonas ossibalaenae]